MNLAIISLSLFFCMKLIYGLWGDSYNDYWSIIYYLSHYFMMVCLLRYMYLLCITKAQRQFFGLGIFYFTALFLLYIICLFSKSSIIILESGDKIIESVQVTAYRKFVAGTGYYGVSAIILLIGVVAINYLRKRRKHDPHNQR